MSHKCSSKSSNKDFKTAEDRCVAHCKSVNHSSKADGHKVKRLRTRKERSLVRVGGRECSEYKPHHCHHLSSKDLALFRSCCHSRCHCPSRRDAPPSNAPQEASVITESRLIGHHGLFNHEVKSIDIERLLTQQRKMDKDGQQVEKCNDTTTNPPSTSRIPSPFVAIERFGGDTDEVVVLEKKPDPTTEPCDDTEEKEVETFQGSDITPGQRPQQQLHLSSESNKSSFGGKILKGKKDMACMSEKESVSQMTPTCDKANVKPPNKKQQMVSSRTLKYQALPLHQTPVQSLSLSLAGLSRSATDGASDPSDRQYRVQKDQTRVSESISAVAGRLCRSLDFPNLRGRNLLAESREVLLRTLQERHGCHLQENLLKVQQYLSFSPECQKQTLMDDPELCSTDAFITACQPNPAPPSCCDTQTTRAFKIRGSRHFLWKPSQNQRLEETSGWFMGPMETSSSPLDEIFRSRCSPHFSLDLKPSSDSLSDRFFSPSPTSHWGAKVSTPLHWEKGFNRPKHKMSVMFDMPSEDFFISHTRPESERSVHQCRDRNMQHLFPYQTQLTEPRHFPQEGNPFENEKFPFAASFSAHVPRRQQNNRHRFSQFSHAASSLSSHHSDMMNYPPSHLLEKGPAPTLSSFPSPEHWSFPPMRLY